MIRHCLKLHCGRIRKKSWETQILGRRCSENLSKIHSELLRTSKMEFLAKLVNGQKPLTIFAKSSFFTEFGKCF